MSRRVGVWMLALFVVLMGVFAVQGRAVDAMRQTWCDQPGCGCPATDGNQTLITFYCSCTGGHAERSCVYG